MENENKLNGIPQNDIKNTETGIPETSEAENEITELRGKNSKVFRMNDGDYKSVFYSGGINERTAYSAEAENDGQQTTALAENETEQPVVTYGWKNGQISSGSVIEIGTSSDSGARRMYIKLSMPSLPGNPRIKKAELKLFQYSGASFVTTDPKIGLYKVTEDIAVGECTPAYDSNLIDYNPMKSGFTENGEPAFYIFDITKLIDTAKENGSANVSLVLKSLYENRKADEGVLLYGSSSSEYAPQLSIAYESSYAVNTSYRTHTYELGRFGQAAIDLACGNLMLESEDFAWQGNRMPVTIKHLYNSALAAYQYTANGGIRLNAADFSGMKLGGGFKLNLMQSMVPSSFQKDGALYSGYVFVGENGEETYFKKSEKTASSNGLTYNLYEDTNGGELKYDPEKKTMSAGEETYYFDSDGRLIKISSGRNSMTITYESGKIASVTDGAGRAFAFAYDADGFLTSVTAPDKTKIEYGYASNRLSTVAYPNGRKAAIVYTYGKPSQIILSENNTDTYKIKFTYFGDRVETVTEYGAENGIFAEGLTAEYIYSAAGRHTVVSTYEPGNYELDEAERKTVYAFDNDGNIVSEYSYSKDTGNVGVSGSESGIRPYSAGGIVSNIDNLLLNNRVFVHGKT